MPTDHPLGDLDSISGTFTAAAPSPAADPAAVDEPSIIDQILDLDAYLSGEVRRPERTAYVCTRPDIEADIDRLHAELYALIDDNGEPLDLEPSLDGRDHQAVALELRAKQVEYAKAMRSIRFRAMPETEWRVFYEANRKDIESRREDIPFWGQLIVKCACAPTFNPQTLALFRERAGATAYDALRQTAFAVNTQAGVSIPKSSLSSAVLRRMRRAQS